MINIQNSHVDPTTLPLISEYDVWEKMCSAKTTKSCIPGDIPGPLFKEFSPELAYPAHKIFLNILKYIEERACFSSLPDALIRELSSQKEFGSE